MVFPCLQPPMPHRRAALVHSSHVRPAPARPLGHKHKKTALLNLGAAPLLVQLLRDDTDSQCATHAADALGSLSHGDEGAAAVAAAGGVAALLVRLCDAASSHPLQHACLRALYALAHTDGFVAELSRAPRAARLVPCLLAVLSQTGNPLAVRCVVACWCALFSPALDDTCGAQVTDAAAGVLASCGNVRAVHLSRCSRVFCSHTLACFLYRPRSVHHACSPAA